MSRAVRTRTMKAERRGSAVRSGVVLALILIGVLLPVYWMVLTSIKPNSELYDAKSIMVVHHPTATHYVDLFATTDFARQLVNSFVVATSATVITVVVGTLGAYSIAHLRYRGRSTAAAGIFFAYLVPPTLLLIPLYTVFAQLDILNRWAGLILAYLTLTVPFCTWMLRGYLQNVPWELEEAAMVDGCGRLRALRSVVLPLIAPGLTAGALFSFTLAWNEYLYAFVFTNKSTAATAPVGLASLVLGDVFLWGQIMAGAVVTAIPILLIYLFGQRFVVGGLTAGAVKG
ncbi:MAG TPA: carbohydrate ABC transporter permease [Micromonosporaceae bacterium]